MSKYDYVRAIDLIRRIKTEETHEREIDRHKAFDLTISALEKQIPKKPIINNRKIQCVNGHNQPTQHYKYCPMCGQLMDWSAHPIEKGGDGE